MAPIFQSVKDVKEQMRRVGLSRIAPAILNLLRPSIRLVVGEPSDQPVTRLGGAPNMPREIAWPIRRSGDPHSFLAQIDLAGLPNCIGFAMPHTGSLFFFCDAEYLPDSDDQQDVKDGIRVIHCASALIDHDLRTPPSELKDEYIFKGLSLKPVLDLTAPAQDIWEIETLKLDGAESDAYCDLFTQVTPHDGTVHRMGGYPNQVQYGREPADDLRLLLQLDSEDNAGMMWGDMGRLYFTIKQSDLEKSAFENTAMDWQCG